ncbi:MAG: rRNA maturation RNase YbeY [Planctomycetota bacterium]|nr:rRNA maturation RNase YbeY [Planctomycetota bacterium]
MFRIELTNEQSLLTVDEAQLRAAVEAILAGEGIPAATISIAVVDDATIHRINREFLQHDYPTDVISFVLDHTPDLLEGEIVVSAQTAIQQAEQYGWPASNELLLYVIHGALHLVGYDDLSPLDLREMRSREQHYLALWGLEAKYADETFPASADNSATLPEPILQGGRRS